MSDGTMGPPLPKRASINASLALAEPEEGLTLTPQKIKKVLSKYTPLKIESPPQRTVISKPEVSSSPLPNENQRPPWNSDVQVCKAVKNSPVTPFTRNVLGEVNQLRGARIPKSFQRRLKESNDHCEGKAQIDELSTYMSSLSTDIKGKDEKIKILEENILQLKRELNHQKLAANARQVEWQRKEIEISQLKAKLEMDIQRTVKDSAEIANLKMELSFALGLLDSEQKEKFKSRIPQI